MFIRSIDFGIKTLKKADVNKKVFKSILKFIFSDMINLAPVKIIGLIGIFRFCLMATTLELEFYERIER